MALSLDASAVCSAFMTFFDRRVNVLGHMCPVELKSHRVVHAMLVVVSHQFWIMLQEKEVFSQEVW